MKAGGWGKGGETRQARKQSAESLRLDEFATEILTAEHGKPYPAHVAGSRPDLCVKCREEQPNEAS